MKIFSYLKKSLPAVFAVIVLLIIQTYSDLSLPTYTSEIVDIGIMQGGITSAAINEIRAESLDNLKLFMLDDDISIVDKAYALNDNGNYILKASDSKTIDKLNDIFSMPMLVVGFGSQSPEFDLAKIKGAYTEGYMTKDQLLEIRDKAKQQALDMGVGETAIEKAAVAYVKSEYEAIGKDLEAIQIKYMLITGAKMIGITLISVTAAIFVCLISSNTAAKICMNLRNRIYSKTMSFSHSEMDKFTSSSLITRNTNDIQQVQMALVMTMRMVFYAPIMGIGGIIKVANTHTKLEWIIAAAVGITLVIVVGLMSFAMPKFKMLQKLVDKVNLVSREILTGLLVIRAFSREKHEEERFDKASRNLMKTQLFTNRTMSFMMPLMMFLMNLISITIVWFGAKGVDLGNMQVGDMMAFITYTMQIFIAFMMISMISVFLPRANVAAERINDVLNTELSITDPESSVSKKYEDKTDWKGDVSFKNVTFRFPNAEKDVLENITFTAEHGKTTAIIGSTGSGKSTIINLLPRFYDVSSGSITIDSVDIRNLSQHKLHNLLGFVPQKGVLFSGTIESNIKFGDEEISDDAMINAAKIAQAENFIEQKAEKYNDAIAQGGTNVSGGQKQRLSIARAIAKNPKIFIFDDSFSALDYKTDVALRRAINENIKDATVLIVAQRISTILHADKIVVLNDGKITGIGTHSELLNSCETYKEIAKSQLSDKELGLSEVSA